jgi:hypothetical protein
LFEKGYEPKKGHGHQFVCFCKLELMRLGLCVEDVVALLLCCGQLHRLTDTATLEVAEELYLTLHEFMHWHECGLLGGAKPKN